MGHTGPIDHLNQVGPQSGPFSVVKDSDGSTVWSNRPWNNYDPDLATAARMYRPRNLRKCVTVGFKLTAKQKDTSQHPVSHCY